MSAGPWHSVPGVLSSFLSLVWCTHFHTFERDQRNSWHTMSDKIQQEAGSRALSLALMVSELSWWRYFFKLSNLIADSGPWYFPVCQGHSALWEPWMPRELWVLALISKNHLLAISVFSVCYYPMMSVTFDLYSMWVTSADLSQISVDLCGCILWVSLLSHHVQNFVLHPKEYGPTCSKQKGVRVNQLSCKTQQWVFHMTKCDHPPQKSTEVG